MSDHLTEPPSPIESENRGDMPWYVKTLIVLGFLAAMFFGGMSLLLIGDNCRLAGDNWSFLAIFLAICAISPLFLLFRAFKADISPGARLTMILLLFVCLLTYGFNTYSFYRTNVWLGSKTEPYGPAFCSVFRTIKGPPMTLDDLNR